MRRMVRRALDLLGLIQAVQWAVGLALSASIGALAAFTVSVFATVPGWELIVCGILAFVAVISIVILVVISRLGDGVERELRFYVAFQRALRALLIRGQAIIAEHGVSYDGPERVRLRGDAIRCIQKYRPEWIGEMGDGTMGLATDVDRISRLIFRIEKHHIAPARQVLADAKARTHLRPS